MWLPILIVLLAVLFIVGGLLAFRNLGRTGLPKVLPPPLPDEPKDDWGQDRKNRDQQP